MSGIFVHFYICFFERPKLKQIIIYNSLHLIVILWGEKKKNNIINIFKICDL